MMILKTDFPESLVFHCFCLFYFSCLSLYYFQISISLSSSLLSEAKTEKYKDLRALLQLLSNLCSKDMVKKICLSYRSLKLECGLLLLILKLDLSN